MVTRGAWRGCCTGLDIDIRGIDIRLRVGRMEVQRRMRWRQTFMAEVAEMLQQLGLKACPVCGSMESLDIGRFPCSWSMATFLPTSTLSAWGRRAVAT